MKDNIKILHEGRFISLVECNGWEYIYRNNCTGIVMILALTDDKKVIFVEQYRPPLKKQVIEFPAGLVNDIKGNDTESFEEAAHRELVEEAGYKAGKMTKVLQGPISSGSSADLITMMFAENLSKVSDGGGDETEDIKVYEIPFAEIDYWLKEKQEEGCLVEPKVYTGLYFLKGFLNKFKDSL